MDAETKAEFTAILEDALRPVQAQLQRLTTVLLEGDDELEIPSLVKRQAATDRRLEEIRADHAKRIRRLELTGTAALVILGTAVTLAVSPDLVAAIARLIALIGLR